MGVRRPKRAKAGILPVISLVVLAAIPAVGFGYLWRWAADKETKKVVEVEVVPELPPALATPVLSFRRAPQTLASVSSQAVLVTALNNVAAFVPDGSCLVVTLDGRVIVDDGGDTKITPASNEKLLTATVALDQLGADYTFATRVAGTVVDGVVQGDLYLIGGGDPTLSTADYIASFAQYAPINTTSFEALVANLQAAGITQITGGIIGDESRYDQERFPPGWNESIRNVEAGPLSALLVNDSTQTVGSTQRYQDPAAGAARLLRTLLRNAGITVAGGTGNGVTPAGTPDIASVQSLPLSAIIADMLTNSDDNTAELLVKELGFHFNGVGSTANGIEVMRGALLPLGIDTTPLTITDGSGLDSANVATCNTLVRVLALKPTTDPLGAGLPIAALSGTLYDQFTGSGVAGRLQAKTGTLNNVRALTGFLPTTIGLIEFSLVLNTTDADDASVYGPIWTAFANAIGNYPSGPTIEQLQPR